MGVSKEEFFDSTPHDLMCYVHAEKMRRKRTDEEAWQAGIYMMSAVSVAVSKALNGRKSKVKYIEKPMSERIEEQTVITDENLTETEKDVERQKLLASLMTMQANFELQHSGENE